MHLVVPNLVVVGRLLRERQRAAGLEPAFLHVGE